MSELRWEQIKTLLHQAMQLSAHARAPFLEISCGSNAALRAELESLLQADQHIQSEFLQSPLRLKEREADPGPVGKSFGPYRVLSLLGYGGMGSVWLAERTDGLFARQVALKLLHPGFMGTVMVERLAREREILAGLNHPHIARLLDAGFAEDGQPYLALEYVVGEQMTSYCDRLRLSVDARLALFQQVLSAVQYAHAHLVIHRDLKPSNILVTAEGQVQLLDFGIAKLMTGGAAIETELTRAWGRALTPDYAAPEQISGLPVTTAADVYALGVMLYELLTGERPYRLPRDSPGALEEAILKVDPIAPSRSAAKESAAINRGTTLKKLANALRGDLDTISMKALRKHPAERYATANAFAEDLARFVAGEAVLARRDSFIYRAWKFSRRHRVAMGVVGALFLALTVGFGVATYEAEVANAQRAAALDAQGRLLVQAAAQRLKDEDVPGAQSMILKVMTDPRFAHVVTPATVYVFQDVRAANHLSAVLSGHGAETFFAAYSPDGTRIVTASRDKTARVWDAGTGAALSVLSGHGAAVRMAAYSPDGTLILTASDDNTSRLWDARTGAELTRLAGHTDHVKSAAFSPDGERIVTASDDKTAAIWAVRAGERLLTLYGHRDHVTWAAYSPDGTRIVTASFDMTARIWDARSGAPIATCAGHTAVVVSAAFSPDGGSVLTASKDGTARFWDARTGEQLRVITAPGGALYTAAFSPDGSRIVTSSYDRTARVWDAASGTLRDILSGHGGTVTSAAYAPDGTRIVTTAFDRTARVWEAVAQNELKVLSGHTDRVYWAAYSSDDSRVITASADKTARVWDSRSGAPLMIIAGHPEAVMTANFSPDRSRIVTSSDDHTVRIWDTGSGTQVAELRGHTDSSEDAVFAPDNWRVVSGSDDGTARVWNTHNGAAIVTVATHAPDPKSGSRGEIYSAVFSPDGSRILTASMDKTARVWDARSGAELLVISGHTERVNSADFSADGTRIVTASSDKTARVWNALTGAQLLALPHESFVRLATFSSAGTRIVTASNDGAVRVWDARTGMPLAKFLGHAGVVYSSRYSTDGSRIVSASADKTARIWDARVPADLRTQFLWTSAAETDPLPSAEQENLGLPLDPTVRHWPSTRSNCDRAAASPEDPDRASAGQRLEDIAVEVAEAACTAEASAPDHLARFDYEMGRAYFAKGDLPAARRLFETAVMRGYRGARLDLADLLLRAPRTEAPLALSLYEKAWSDGVTAAAYHLGSLYEHGIAAASAPNATLAADVSAAWRWYAKGADALEPNALARLAARDEALALEASGPRRDASLLQSLKRYAAAAERARQENWPESVWAHWRFRRGSLARYLGREGLMQPVADAYAETLAQIGSNKSLVRFGPRWEQ